MVDARVGRFAAAQKGERMVVRGAATSTSASRIDWGVEDGLQAIGAREGEMQRQRCCIVLRNSGRRVERKEGQRRVQEKVAASELGEDGPHTQRQVLHLAKAVHTLVSAPRENCGHHGSMQSTSTSPQASGTEAAGETETLGDLEPACSTAIRPARRSPSPLSPPPAVSPPRGKKEA